MECSWEPRINPQTSVIMTKEPRVFNGEKDSRFGKWFWENRTAASKRTNLDQHVTPCMKIKSKWVKDLSISSETTKLLEESNRCQLFSISLGEIALDLSPQARASTAKINKWDHMKLKYAFSQWRKSAAKWKGYLLLGRRHLQIIYLVRG